MARRFFILLVISILIAASISHAQTINPITLQADSFVEGIGTRTRMCYDARQKDTNFFSTTLYPRLVSLGIRHNRDSTCEGGALLPPYISKLSQLSQAGISFSFHVHPALSWDSGSSTLTISPGSEDPRNNTTGLIPKLKQLLNAGVKISAIDGVNEPDHVATNDPDCAWNSDWYVAIQNCPEKQYWKETTIGYTQALWAGIKGDPQTQNISVNAPALVHLEDYASKSVGGGVSLWSHMQSNILPYVSRGTGHFYCWRKGQFRCFQSQVAPRENFFGALHATEFGYYTRADTTPDFDVSSEQQQAKYLSRALFDYLDRWPQGRAYIHELMDHEAPGEPFQRLRSYGILNYDGSPKLSYTTIKNIISILTDKGEVFTPTPLDFTLDFVRPDNTVGATNNNIRATVFQKRNGNYYIALRHELNGASSDTDVSDTVRLKIPESGNRHIQTRLFDPRISATTPIASTNDERTHFISVPDSVLIFEVIFRSHDEPPPSIPTIVPTAVPTDTPIPTCKASAKVVRKSGRSYIEAKVLQGTSKQPYVGQKIVLQVKKKGRRLQVLARKVSNRKGVALIRIVKNLRMSDVRISVEDGLCSCKIKRW